MNYKTGHRAAMIVLFSGLCLALIASMMETGWLEIVGVCLSLLGIVADAIVYRCPFCHKSLAGHGKQPQHCPHCGAQLDYKKVEDPRL